MPPAASSAARQARASSSSSSLGLICVTALTTAVCMIVANEGYRRYSDLLQPVSPPIHVAPASHSAAVPAAVAAAADHAVSRRQQAAAPPPPPPPAAAPSPEPCPEVEYECEACPDCPAPSQCPPPPPPPPTPTPAPPASCSSSSSSRPPAHRDPPRHLHKRPPRRPPPEMERNECIEVDPNSPDLDFPLSASEGRSLFNNPFTATNSAFEEYTGEVLLGDCSCPLYNKPENWTFDCGAYDWRILTELTSPWHRMNFTPAAIDAAWSTTIGNIPPTYHYAIRDGRLWGRSRGPLSGWAPRLENMLRTVVGMVKLPNVEFSVNYFDHPKVARQDPMPVFGFTRDAAMSEIATPFAHSWTRGDDYEFHLNPQCPPYEQRKEKLFFRGSCTGPTVDYNINYKNAYLRTSVTLMTQARPDLLDAGVTNQCFVHEPEGTFQYLPYANSDVDMCMHKFLLQLDGNTISGRSSHILHSGSTMFKPDSVFSEWSYHLLRPWIHYVPVRENLDDLIEQIEWAKRNPKSAECIARNAKRFAEKHIRKEMTACVWWRLFSELARKQPQGSRTEGLSPL